MRKRKVLTLIILSIAILLGVAFAYKASFANGITGDAIKEIKLGMPLEQVISILGMPYEIDFACYAHDSTCKNPRIESNISVNENTDIIHTVDCIYNNANYCCDAYKESMQKFGKKVTLTYTKKYPSLISFFVDYPMLWVHLDSDYRVKEVYAKRYEFIESICIYSLSWKYNKTIFDAKQEDVKFFINEELFNKCFK